MRALKRDSWIGLFFTCFAMVLMFVWVPLDVESGYIEKVRRQVIIGDALAPSVAGAFLLVGGLCLLWPASGHHADQPMRGLRFTSLLFLIYALAFALMLGAGPLAVAAFGLDMPYRDLRDTAPWKYIGFAFGGTFAISATISLLERRVTLSAMVIAVIAVLAMIALYDLPFDDLLLPPNGDV